MRKFIIVLLVMLAVFAALIAVIAVFAYRNKQKMNALIECGRQEIEKITPLQECMTQSDREKSQDMRVYGLMKFHVEQYKAGAANLSVMTADMGFMQMASFVFTPLGREVPLCSMDFMYIMGNRKSYVEFYDLAGDTDSEQYHQVMEQLKAFQARYADLPEIPAEPHWYDHLLNVCMHKQLRDDARNQEFFCDTIRTYLQLMNDAPESSAELTLRQRQNTRDYCNGLVDKSGVSTDVFKKAFGPEITREFFGNVFFGTEHR